MNVATHYNKKRIILFIGITVALIPIYILDWNYTKSKILFPSLPIVLYLFGIVGGYFNNKLSIFFNKTINNFIKFYSIVIYFLTILFVILLILQIYNWFNIQKLIAEKYFLAGLVLSTIKLK